jgi:hypothetical protein
MARRVVMVGLCVAAVLAAHAPGLRADSASPPGAVGIRAWQYQSPISPEGIGASMSVLAFTALMALMFVTAPAQDKTPPKIIFSNPPPSEWVHIDGSKNPELIPQWTVWRQAFHNMAQVSNIPTEVIHHLSPKEQESLLAAARADVKKELGCQERVLEIMPLLSTGDAKQINDKTKEINLDCRWQTLNRRDQVLESLNPEGRSALVNWVESNKAGMSVRVPKSELAFFRQPQ